MEIPDNLKHLYRHWDFHTKTAGSKRSIPEFEDKVLFNKISWFISERMHIWKKKTAGEKPPFTKDAIFSQYRFCNILREFDRQTIEFHTLLNPLREDFPLWLLNMFYFRMVARTETVKNIGFLSFDEVENKKFYKKIIHSPRPRFGTPYVFPISVIQKSNTPTRELFIARYLPSVIKGIAGEITRWNRKSVYDGVASIIPLFKYSLYFLWTEVLIDVAYQFPEYVDLFERFPIGPGSLPTMHKINDAKDPTLLVQGLASLEMDIHLVYNGKPIRLSAENWEGIGCEFRKYTHLKEGKGRRRLFST